MAIKISLSSPAKNFTHSESNTSDPFADFQLLLFSNVISLNGLGPGRRVFLPRTHASSILTPPTPRGFYKEFPASTQSGRRLMRTCKHNNWLHNAGDHQYMKNICVVFIRTFTESWFRTNDQTIKARPKPENKLICQSLLTDTGVHY